MGPPNLDDSSLYERRAGVPILDVHSRNGWDVDLERLQLVAKNSNDRVARGELGLILLGHTDDVKPEKDQPPLVGYMRNYRIGDHAGQPAILADLFLNKADDPPKLLKNFPRRSVEVYYSDKNPNENFVDGLALLVRSPARSLGLTYAKSNRQKERYSMADQPDIVPAAADDQATQGVTIGDIPALQSWMQANSITDVVAGIKGFLNARAAGNLSADNGQFGQGDIAGLQQYAKARGIHLNAPGAYNATLERYKASKRAGTLNQF